MSTEYDGEPLDHGWKSYIGSDNGETVEASNNGEQEGDISTMYWPEELPESAFENDASGLQKDIIETAAKIDAESNSHIADMVGCSRQHVQSVKSKVSIFVEPGTVNFDIPETPNKNGLTEGLLDHEQCRFEADTWEELLDKPGEQNGGAGKPIDIKEIGDRFYNGEDAESIARDFGITPKQVTGYLSQYSEDADKDKNLAGGAFGEFDSLKGIFPDHYIEIFNKLASGQDIDHISESMDLNHGTVRRVIYKSACYVEPEKLPFEAPDEPPEWALSEEDKNALQIRQQKGAVAGVDNWPTETEPHAVRTNGEGEDKPQQSELPEGNDGEKKETDGSESARRKRVQTRVDNDTLAELRDFKEERGINKSEAIRRLMRKGLTTESVEDCVNEDLEARVHDLEKAIQQKESKINELAERVEGELTARERRERRERKKAEAGLLTRAKWSVFGMDLDEDRDG